MPANSYNPLSISPALLPRSLVPLFTLSLFPSFPRFTAFSALIPNNPFNIAVSIFQHFPRFSPLFSRRRRIGREQALHAV
jgi:hypothetical protein